MSSDPTLASMARLLKPKTLRIDRETGAFSWSLPASWDRLVLAALAIFFLVLVGAIDLDVGPSEARLGLAAGERPGPLGQVVGYWAPDLWPGQVLPSFLLAQLDPGGRPSSAAVRWPAAFAGILAGWILVGRMARVMGTRAGLFMGLCWFGSIALIDRSGAAGLDLIVGLATLAALDRLIARGPGWPAGLWASLAFLSGGWPPLVLIGLAVIVMGRKTATFSLALVVPPLLTAIVWSAWTTSVTSAEPSSALALPLTKKPSWLLGLGVLGLGLPWSPFASLLLARSARESWKPDGRAWMFGWLQVAIAALIAGSLVPGLDSAARLVVLAGLSIAAAAGLDAAWTGSLSRSARRTFFVLFSIVTTMWLCVMIYGTYIWNLCFASYRLLGVVMAVLIIAVAVICWLALATRGTRFAVASMVLIAIGLKLAYWGYYVPEWNYRYSQGPWARAIAQWMPRKWTLYTLHDWPPDLAFFTKRIVRQLPSPHHLTYQPGSACKFVLLLPSEFENWPPSALPITFVARFQDQSAGERILARTPGHLPLPPGRDPATLSLLRGDEAPAPRLRH